MVIHAEASPYGVHETWNFRVRATRLGLVEGWQFGENAFGRRHRNIGSVDWKRIHGHGSLGRVCKQKHRRDPLFKQ
ncbi:hypothetical protein AVEN_124738-1, partial [Araneus ventricosus]